jgi:hypothetical protein
MHEQPNEELNSWRSMTIPDELGSRVWWRIPGLQKTIKAAGVKFPLAEAKGVPGVCLWCHWVLSETLNDNLLQLAELRSILVWKAWHKQVRVKCAWGTNLFHRDIFVGAVTVYDCVLPENAHQECPHCAKRYSRMKLLCRPQHPPWLLPGREEAMIGGRSNAHQTNPPQEKPVKHVSAFVSGVFSFVHCSIVPL